MTSPGPKPGWLWVTDPWETLDHRRDTTLRLVEATLRKGIPCAWADVRTLRWGDEGATLDAFAVASVAPERGPGSFERVALGPRRPSDFAMVHYRPDPPVDLCYLQPLQLIDLDVRHRAAEDGVVAEIVNPAPVLAGCSEKLVACCGSGLAPPTLAASTWEALAAFGEREGRTIAKPMHDCQSKGVALLDWRTAEGRAMARSTLEGLSVRFSRPVVLQRYLPAVLEGETRLWLVDGELVACVRKRAADGTYKIDMDKGGTLVPHRLTDAERARLPRIRAVLAERGIRLAAVDLIDGLVTDFNFTSPGLLPLIEDVVGENVARRVVELLARPGGVRSARETASRPGRAA